MTKTAILYDSYCKICNAEIQYYKRMDKNNIFNYIDIINPEFKPETFGLTKSDVHKYFHVVTKQGDIIKGVDAFHYIWKELNAFKLLQKAYELKLGKLILNIGYSGFVRFRPYLPRKKDCGDYCEI